MNTTDEALLVIIFFTICLGICFNTFIVVVTFKNWMKDRKLSPPDLIIFYLGISSGIFEILHFSAEVSSYIWSDLLSTVSVCLIYFHTLLLVSVFFIIFLTSWLCTFYCIKLVCFHHHLLTFVRSRLSTIYPCILRGTLGISCVLLIFQYVIIFITVPLDYTNNNSTSYCTRISDRYLNNIQTIQNVSKYMTTLPFLLILMSLGATLTYLLLYIRRVQKSPSLDNSHLRAYINATTTITLLLVLNAAFYVSYFLWNVMPFPLSMICLGIVYGFWPLQALTLIFMTKKLKNNCLNVFKNMKGCLQKHPDR